MVIIRLVDDRYDRCDSAIVMSFSLELKEFWREKGINQRPTTWTETIPCG